MTEIPDHVTPPAPPKVDSEAISAVLAEKSITSSVLTHLLGWVGAFSVGGLMMALVLIGARLATSEAGGPQQIKMEQEVTGQMLYAAGPGGMNIDSSLLVPSLSQLKDGSLVSRLAYVILASELDSPAAGLVELESIHDETSGTFTLTSEEQALLDDVSVLLFAAASGERADALPEARAEFLRQSLGFFGELLIAKSSGDQKALDDLSSSAVSGMVTLLVAAVWFLSFFLGGLASFIILGIFAAYGKLKLRFAVSGSTGSVYIETFAIWIGMFFLLQIITEGLVAILGSGSLGAYIGPEFSMIISLIMMFVCLSALVWPMIRGVSSTRLLEDIGLGPVNIFKEIIPGFVTYAMGLPLLLVGLGLSAALGFVLNALFGEQPAASHPIQTLIGEGGWMTMVLIFLVACVGAPVTEEIMFRGVLYRYLRECSRTWALLLSVFFSMLVSSFIFAAVHPQGLTYIPVLGSLAVAFCIGREWRGSLVAPMIAHGLSNGVVLTMNFGLF